MGENAVVSGLAVIPAEVEFSFEERLGDFASSEAPARIDTIHKTCPRSYSVRSASTGSTAAARRAGR